MTERRLVITADDFGLHPSVNKAVEIAHLEGVLTAASLMVGAPAFDQAVRLAQTLPSLRVGLHITLTDGRPVLPASEIPHLTTPEGRFRTDLFGYGVAIFASAAARRELAAEIEAQFAAFADTGLTLDHANAHQHFHVHPTIAALIAKIGARHGLRVVRVPVEPTSVLRRLESVNPTWPERLVSWWGAQTADQFRAAGMTVPDQVFGLRWTGQFGLDRLESLIGALPPGLSEVYLHPAVETGFAGSAPGYDYPGELASLVSDEVRSALIAGGVRSGGFLDFV